MCLLMGNVWCGVLYVLIVFDNVDLVMVLVCEEIFGFVLFVIVFDMIDDVIWFSNGMVFGLLLGVCMDSMVVVVWFVNELNVGMVNVWEVFGYWIELLLFGGIKDLGFGYKEGV